MKKRHHTHTPAPPPCLCGSGQTLVACCDRFHRGEVAPDAEALMRSRYSAYVLGLEPYLIATWHPSTRPARLGLDSDSNTKWLGLDVRHHANIDENTATVEFVARYKVGGRAARLHETSRFVREDGRWFYIAGDLHHNQGL